MAQTRTQIGSVQQAGPFWEARPTGQTAKMFPNEQTARNFFRRGPSLNTAIGKAPVGAISVSRVEYDVIKGAVPARVDVFLVTTT